MKAKLTWFFRSFIWLGVLMLAIDFLSKQLVAAYAPFEHNVAIIPGFLYLYNSRNSGAAFSWLAGNQTVLAIVSLVAGIAMVAYYIVRFKTLKPWYRVAWILMATGTWGNFVDRAFFPDGVIDFISMHFWSYTFATYNVADACLTVGIGILLALTVIEEIQDSKKKKAEGKK